jgi:DNA-binding beta-propeller fold protein YncE
MAMRRKAVDARSAVMLLLAFLLGLTFPAIEAEAATLRGTIKSDRLPLESFSVKLFRTDGTRPARLLGQTFSRAGGVFRIDFATRDDPHSILYLIAQRGPAAVATVLGPAPLDVDNVVVNERTTVAAAYTLAQFIRGSQVSGNRVGIRNSASMFRNLVDAGSGELASVLRQSPNGPETSALPTFNALANMVSACVRDRAACRDLFDAARSPGRPAPRQTLQAVVSIARNPWHNVRTLFAASRIGAWPYRPALAEAPNAWTRAIRFRGDPMTMNGPGNFAIDGQGNLWVTDNYEWAPPDGIACAGQALLKFTPTGEFFPGSPYFGGGLDGAGFGITLDPDGHVWVGNFGFEAPECSDTPEQATHNSVSEFLPDGTAVSPDETGYTAGKISWPQGTVSDRDGNIWIANCGNDSVTIYPDGDPRRARNLDFTRAGLIEPFDIAIDRRGRAWVTFNEGNAVAIIELEGWRTRSWTIPNRHADDPAKAPFRQPMGIASDSKGNMWVANSGIVHVPCPGDGSAFPPGEVGGSITLIHADGRVALGSPFTGGGLAVPWGVAVDGNDNVWVANFGGGDDEGGSLLSRLSLFCGTERANCPPGYRTGDPISPVTGFTSDALDRVTGLAVDPSGNVWAVDNWKFVARQNNPAGQAIVAFLGIAGPLRTPLIGPPIPARHGRGSP